VEFSLFYFADSADTAAGIKGRYRLLIDGARYADSHSFTAVWTPERHFHPFGGQYPNPAVAGAALAMVTERVRLRAGSVVAPLHHPLRIAEEWSVVDNLSGGRAEISFASGWHAVDFALAPQNYERRKDVFYETVDAVRRLWRQDEVEYPDGTGAPARLRAHPAPVQPELPFWITSAGSEETFRAAGSLGAGLLTHLLGQEPHELAGKIAAYREAYAARGGDPADGGRVALMLHTYLGTDREEVRELVREPFSTYLRSSLGLFARAAAASVPGLDVTRLSPEDVQFLIARSFDRYFDTGGLFGTVEEAEKTVAQLRQVGVDEIAALIDFGVAPDLVLEGLDRLDELRRRTASV
jgi:natural product biosynthesis luciferase-like monooxygenase protein